MDITVPEGHGRPEEIVRTDRGKLNSVTHYVQALDDVILAPIRFTTSFLLQSGATKMLLHEFMAILFANGQDATWNAGAANQVLVTTKGTSQLPDGLTGTLVTLPLLTDPKKKCVNVEVLWDDLAASKVGRKLSEVYFPPSENSLNEAADMVRVNMAGDVYGATTVITDFTAGTEIAS
jgi:hypothetical protein